MVFDAEAAGGLDVYIARPPGHVYLAALGGFDPSDADGFDKSAFGGQMVCGDSDSGGL